MVTFYKVLQVYLFILVLFSPLYVLRWSYFGVLPTTLLELLIWGLVVLWLVWKIRNSDISWPSTSFDMPVLLILAATSVAIVVSHDRLGALGIARAYFWEPILVFYLLTDIKRTRPGWVIGINRSVLLGLMSTAVWLSALGIVQVLLGFGVMAPDQFNRAHAVFNNGNALALWLGPLLYFFFGLEVVRQFKLPNWVRYVGMVLVGLCLILTDSTGALLALLGIIALITVPYYFLGPAKILKFVLAGSLVASVALLVISPMIAPETDNPWVRGEGTGGVRICLWDGTSQLLRDNALFGVGLSGFKEQYSAEYYTCDAEPLEYPHNFWMTVWAELGVLGVISFFWLFWNASDKIARARWPATLTAALIFILLHGLVDVPYFKNDLSLQYWILLSLLF